VVQGNYFGTNAAGDAAIPNQLEGAFVADNTGYQIGGTAAGAGNVFAGNGRAGLALNGVTDSLVQANRMGVRADGVIPLGNGGDGLLIIGLAAPNTDNLIGGTTAEAGNIIAFNGKNGITLLDEAGSGNQFLRNNIFSNGQLGIDLDNDGVTTNDAADADAGANNRQNAPVLTQADLLTTGTRIVGKIASVPNSSFRVELFTNAEADPSGMGEGQSFIGFVDATTNAAGNASFEFNHPLTLAGGTPITATATRAQSGDTSEFSKAVPAAVPINSPNIYVYQDLDGDRVTLKFSKPILNGQTIGSLLTFSTGSVLNGITVPHQLRSIDLHALADPQAAKGTTITVTATRSATDGGDGFAAIGQINAAGIDLGAVTIDGDLGRIVAGDATTTTTGLAALTARSIGRYGTATGAADLHSDVQGALGVMTVKADVKDAFISATGAINSIKIAGDLIGGSTVGTTNPQQAGHIRAQRIGSLTIGGSLIAGTKTAAGAFEDNGTIRVADDIGTLTIGNIVGNPTNRAIISARGRATPTPLTDTAIGRLTVRGRVEFAHILAGFNVAGVGVNADAQIGVVVVRGDWVASSLVAGVSPGAGGHFGDLNDSKLAGAGVKDDGAIASQIRSVSIAGQALGTVPGGDHFGIVAENVTLVKVGGVKFPTNSVNGTDDFFVGITGDFRVNEV
jgi:hypothetical protein